MPISLAATKRYIIIDECLRNDYHIPSTSTNPRHRGIWSVDDLAQKIREKLDLAYLPSERTIKGDIHVMRSGDLGYLAPIHNERGIGYYYADPNFSISMNPLSEIDIENLKEVLAILKQFRGFKYFSDVNSIISKIEDTVNISEYNHILFDTVPDAKGLEFIEPLSKAIRSSRAIAVDYQPFYQEAPSPLIMHPYLLKEYNNRWFVLAYSMKDQATWVFALDRIKGISFTKEYFQRLDNERIQEYFKHIVGVSRPMPDAIEKVVLKINRSRSNYIITKPIHPSQKIIGEDKDTLLFEFQVIPNLEFQAYILSLGNDCEVLEPLSLRNSMLRIVQEMVDRYMES